MMERGGKLPHRRKNFCPRTILPHSRGDRLEVGRRDIAQRRVQALALVKDFDVLEQVRTSLTLIFINFVMTSSVFKVA